MKSWTSLFFGLLTSLFGTSIVALAEDPAVLKREFIYETAPFPECHASTIVETPKGLVVAWFGGTEEKDPDVGIWVSRQDEAGAWTAPIEVANGVESATKRYPCWNPVLFQFEKELVLFYKVGPSPSEWWGALKRSQDHGVTWSAEERLPDGILGPVKNKPILLSDGTLLCGSSSEHDGWRVHMEFTKDKGKSWEKTGFLNPKGKMESIQPTLLKLPNGEVRMLCRSKSAGEITSALSKDSGRTWTELTTLSVNNPNSGIDAVTLADGRHLLVYNDTKKGRGQLNVAISEDGVSWKRFADLEDTRGAEFSYPAVIQTADGKVHITYTWKRQKVRHIVLDVK